MGKVSFMFHCFQDFKFIFSFQKFDYDMSWHRFIWVYFAWVYFYFYFLLFYCCLTTLSQMWRLKIIFVLLLLFFNMSTIFNHKGISQNQLLHQTCICHLYSALEMKAQMWFFTETFIFFVCVCYFFLFIFNEG